MLKSRAREEASNPRLAKAALAKRMEAEQAARQRLLTHHDSAVVRNAVGSMVAGITAGYLSHVPHNLSTLKLMEPARSYRDIFRE